MALIYTKEGANGGGGGGVVMIQWQCPWTGKICPHAAIKQRNCQLVALIYTSNNQMTVAIFPVDISQSKQQTYWYCSVPVVCLDPWTINCWSSVKEIMIIINGSSDLYYLSG